MKYNLIMLKRTNVVLETDVIDKLRELGVLTYRSVSSVYREAMDLYIQMLLKKKKVKEL